MNPTTQRRARELARTEAESDPDTLAALERRVQRIERRLGAFELRLADAFAAERHNLRAELDQLRAELAKGRAPKPAAKRSPKRTTPSNSTRK